MTLTIFLPKPTHISYGEAMNRVRMWLDYRKVQTTGFKLATGERTGFEIIFSSPEEAVRFQTEFGWPPPPQAPPPALGAEESP